MASSITMGMMLLLIFGAGASYDAVPAYPPSEHHPLRLPVSDQLFSREYQEELKPFPRLQPVLTYLRGTSANGVEETLETLQSEADDYPDRLKQLLAARFYLQSLIARRDTRWHEADNGATNHLTVFDEIRRLLPAKEQVLVVTFNYDRLVERALASLGEFHSDAPPRLEWYTNDRFMVFKMHGSVDWGRSVGPMRMLLTGPGIEQMNALIESAPNVQLEARILPGFDVPIRTEHFRVVVPAIAIPLRRKQEFELPESHLNALKVMLKRVTRVISVGWRATDDPFLELLKIIEGDVPGLVVAHKNPDDPVKRLQDTNSALRLTGITGGFSAFVKSRELSSFLQKTT